MEFSCLQAINQNNAHELYYDVLTRLVGAEGQGGTFEGVNKNNCCRSFFCMLITKKLSIQTDSEALCPYLGIKVTWSLHYN